MLGNGLRFPAPMVKLHKTKGRRKSMDKSNVQRSCSQSYTLPQNNTSNVSVCKEYNLSTLCYNSDKVLSYLFLNNSSSKIATQKDEDEAYPKLQDHSFNLY